MSLQRNASHCLGAVVPALALTLFALAGPVAAAEQERAIVTSPDGSPVMNGYGDCWHSPYPPDEEQTELMKTCGEISDSDGDGVIDSEDQCPDTPQGAEVDSDGCEIVHDSDGDGVADDVDQCPGTESGRPVDADGCLADADNDGVADDVDQCPGTESGRPVDADGCLADADNDGIGDDRDQCPNTPAGEKVNSEGCEIMKSISIDLDADEFEFDSAKLKPAMERALDDAIERMKSTDAEEQLDIVGYTDSIGTREYNQGLSERRAQSVADYLEKNGVARSSMSVSGRGENNPVASNDNKQGRAQNRRVDIETH